MKLFCLVFVLLGVIAVKNEVNAESDPASKAEITATLDLTKQAIDGADSILLSYVNDVLQTASRNKIDGPFEEIITKHGKDIVGENEDFISSTKTKLMDTTDSLFSATQDVYEFFGLVSPLLNNFVRTISGDGAQRVLALIFDNSKLLKAQTELENTSSYLKTVTEKITLLRSQYQNKSGEKNESIYKLCEQAIDSYQKAYTSIDTIINKLKDEYKIVDNLKSQIEKSKSSPITDDVAELRDSVIQSAQKLIADINEHKSALSL